MNLLLILASWSLTTSFYSLQFETGTSQTITMSQYAGKKILLVNIATGSSKAPQLAKLQQLQQQFGDSLVVIGFPSNSFGKESRSDSEIKDWCAQQYGVSFLLAKKAPIAGASIQAVYKWLTTQSDNGVIGDAIRGDFQKFLIGRNGTLIGIFSPSIDPLSPDIVNAVSGE